MSAAPLQPPPASPAAASSPNGAASNAEYTAEVRFGVVMYGGVSLAIYINGVTNELFEMACATPRDGVSIDAAGEPFTRGIYRRLSWLVGNASVRKDYAARIVAAKDAAGAGDWVDAWPQVATGGATQTRFAVDVVAGTSAGGINGIFLAKALANGEEFGALKNLWINEGDIALLLNDEKSYLDTDPPILRRDASPTSLLNSDRMYAKLHYALGSMRPLPGVARARPDDRSSPLADEVDLYVTTTDIKGSPVPLRLFDKVVYERRYKQSYHFRYPNGLTLPDGNDFGAVNTSFLAFAARCTSSFPFAFEPMTLSALTRLKVAGAAPGVLRWNAFFPNLARAEVAGGRHVDRAFGDGGYLDNKPFTYVVEALSSRFGGVPLERKLLFVEPSPEHIDPDSVAEQPDAAAPPDAVENSLAALTSIPQYETIREDLQAVLARNRRIERIERVVRLGERGVRVTDPFSIRLTADGTIPDWSSLTLEQMIGYYGTAYVPYQRLRVYAVTDALADRLGKAWDIDRDSDQQYALRALVRVWRERHFDDDGSDGKATINAFLDDFDVDYRIRRLGFLLRKVDRLTRLFHRRAAGPLGVDDDTLDGPDLSEEETQLLEMLPPPFQGLPPSLSDARVRDAERVLRVLKRGLLEARTRVVAAVHAIDASPPDGALGDALRADLDTILLQVLGRTSSDRAPEIHAAGSGTQRVVLDAQPSRMASASQTLQESVVYRAELLLNAAERVAGTPLEERLVGGIEQMRVKRAGEDLVGGGAHLHEGARLAWQLLGCPKLKLDRERGCVEAGVDDAVVDGLDPALRSDLPLLDGDDGALLRRFLGMYYLRFDTFDQMSFPLYYDTGTGEPSTVEVVRVSPVDATNLIDETSDGQRRKKLAGTALANFGAFLDRRWRQNDIMWGQLDGVERLVEALLPMSDDATRVVRKELIERAQRSILRAALVPDGQATLADLVIRALDESPPHDDPGKQLKDLFERLWSGNPVARDRMAGVLVSLLSEPGLMDFVRETRKTDPEADPEATLKSAARAVTITGRVLEVVSRKHGGGKAVPMWLARLGLVLQGIVAVSLPGTLNQRWWTHAMKVLYAFEVVLVALGFVFGSPDMRSLAVTALATTIGIHLSTLIAGDLMRERKRWLYAGLMALFAGIVALATVGALVLIHQGVQQQMCWVRPGTDAPPGAASWVCDRAGRAQRWWSGTPR